MVDIDLVEHTLGHVVGKGAIHVGARRGAVGRAQGVARERPLAHGGHRFEGAEKSLFSHGRGGERLLEQARRPIADVRHRRADERRAQRDVVDHPHLAVVDVLNHDLGRRAEHGHVDHPGHQDILQLGRLGLDDALEHDQDNAKQKADPGQLLHVPGPRQHRHGVEDGREEGGIANGVNRVHQPILWETRHRGGRSMKAGVRKPTIRHSRRSCLCL